MIIVKYEHAIENTVSRSMESCAWDVVSSLFCLFQVEGRYPQRKIS